MGLIYLIEICDGLVGTLITLTVLSGILTLILAIVISIMKNDGEDITSPVKYIKGTIITFVISLLGCTLVPSTSAGYRIAAIGTTMEYLQNSKEAKQLPDNTFKMLNRVINKIEQDSTTTAKK